MTTVDGELVSDQNLARPTSGPTTASISRVCNDLRNQAWISVLTARPTATPSKRLALHSPRNQRDGTQGRLDSSCIVSSVARCTHSPRTRRALDRELSALDLAGAVPFEIAVDETVILLPLSLHRY